MSTCIFALTALLLTQADAAPLTTAEATVLRLGGDRRAAWQPRAITLAPAKWIWLPSHRTLPNTFVLFRKEIELSAVPTSAFGWIAADSRYLVTVNGQRVQRGPAPCDPRNLDADSIDLKPFLKSGKNVIGVQVLFYGHGDGTWPGGKPGLILNLDLDVAGVHQQVVTDKSWLAILDRAHQPGHYKRWFLRALQEEFDARLWPTGWDTVDCRPDGRWLAAQEIDCPPDKGAACRTDGWSADSVDRAVPEVSSLRLRQIPPTRETLIPAKGLAHSGRVQWNRDPADWFDMRVPDSFVVETAPVAVARSERTWELPATPKPEEGVEATFELAEQLAGFVRFRIDAPAGTIVELMVQESHDSTQTRWLDTSHFCWSRFICREGNNEFETFDYESLRWIQLHIRNASRPVTVSDVGVRRRQYAWSHEPLVCTSEPAAATPVRCLHQYSAQLISGLRRGRRRSRATAIQRRRQPSAARDPLCVRRAAALRRDSCAHSARDLPRAASSWTATRLTTALPGCHSASWTRPIRARSSITALVSCSTTGTTTSKRVTLTPSANRSLACCGSAIISGLCGTERACCQSRTWASRMSGSTTKPTGISATVSARSTSTPPRCITHALAPLADAMGDAEARRTGARAGAQLLQATTARFWSRDERIFVDNLPWLSEDKRPRMSDRALATSVLFGQCPGGDTAAARARWQRCPKTWASPTRATPAGGTGRRAPRSRRCCLARSPHALGHDALRDRKQYVAGSVACANRLHFAVEPLPSCPAVRAASRHCRPASTCTRFQPAATASTAWRLARPGNRQPYAAWPGGVQGST